MEPARKLARWKNIRVFAASASGTYHRVYDPCIPKFLNQAGVKTDFVRFEDVGIRGNSHVMMLEKNSDDIIKYITGWLQKNVELNPAGGIMRKTSVRRRHRRVLAFVVGGTCMRPSTDRRQRRAWLRCRARRAGRTSSAPTTWRSGRSR